MSKERVYEVYVSQKLFKKHHVWAHNQEDARQKISAMLDGSDIGLIGSMTSHQAGESKIVSVQRDDSYLGAEYSERDPQSTSSMARVLGSDRHTVTTRVFAGYVGEQIAAQRESYPIGDVFCAVMRQHHVVDGDTSLSAWADAVTALIAADTDYDSESQMARRAVSAVLHQAFGSEMRVSGFPLPRPKHTTKD